MDIILPWKSNSKSYSVTPIKFIVNKLIYTKFKRDILQENNSTSQF